MSERQPSPFGETQEEFVPVGLKRTKDITLSGFYGTTSRITVPKIGTRIVMTFPLSDTEYLKVYGKVTARRRVKK